MENRDAYPPTRQHVMTLYYLLRGVTQNKPEIFPPHFLNVMFYEQHKEMAFTVITGMTDNVNEVENGFIYICTVEGDLGSTMVLEAIDKGAVAILTVDEVTGMPDEVFYMVRNTCRY